MSEQLFDELTLTIKTSLPCTTDAEVEERAQQVETLISRLGTMIEHLFSPGGPFHIKGFSLKLERR